MLTTPMKKLITEHPAGMVATVDAQGLPAVSPKATFVIVDDETIAYGDIRSPGTARNLSSQPAVQVCFLDPIRRKAVRVAGTGEIVPKDQANAAMMAAFESAWAPYLKAMKSFVRINVKSAQLILSPAYDIGLTEAELVNTNLARLNALHEAGTPD